MATYVVGTQKTRLNETFLLSTACYVMSSGQKYRELKEMRQKETPEVNLVTPVAQALEMAKSELKRKQEDSITDGGRKTATSNWISLRY